jgi:exosortase H (IPTLxxWG-CTERM-specific)
MVARNAFRFALIAGVLFGLYSFPYAENGLSEGWIQQYLNAYAHCVGACLRLFESSVSVHGNTVIGSASIQIVKSCDAMEAMILFAAAVLAFPAPIVRKLTALVAGVAAITCVNVIRISSLYSVLVNRPQTFEFLHLELWPMLMIVTSLVLFFLSTRFLLRAPLEPGRNEEHGLA